MCSNSHSNFVVVEEGLHKGCAVLCLSLNLPLIGKRKIEADAVSCHLKANERLNISSRNAKYCSSSPSRNSHLHLWKYTREHLLIGSIEITLTISFFFLSYKASIQMGKKTLVINILTNAPLHDRSKIENAIISGKTGFIC